MADISAEIAAFKNAVYGEDVRDAMVSLANKLNNEVIPSSEVSKISPGLIDTNRKLIRFKGQTYIPHNLVNGMLRTATDHVIDDKAYVWRGNSTVTLCQPYDSDYTNSRNNPYIIPMLINVGDTVTVGSGYKLLMYRVRYFESNGNPYYEWLSTVGWLDEDVTYTFTVSGLYFIARITNMAGTALTPDNTETYCTFTSVDLLDQVKNDLDDLESEYQTHLTSFNKMTTGVVDNHRRVVMISGGEYVPHNLVNGKLLRNTEHKVDGKQYLYRVNSVVNLCSPYHEDHSDSRNNIYDEAYFISAGDTVTTAPGYKVGFQRVAPYEKDGVYYYLWKESVNYVTENQTHTFINTGLYVITTLMKMDESTITADPSETYCTFNSVGLAPRISSLEDVIHENDFLFKNPYNLTWEDNFQEVLSVTHCHCTSDTELANLANKYDHAVISNYYPSKPWYPLSEFFNNIPSGFIASPGAEITRMSDVNGSVHFGAVNAYIYRTSDKFDGTTKDACRIINRCLVNKNQGGITINHPTYSNLSGSDIVNLMDNLSGFFGMEVYNSNSEASQSVGYAIEQWDYVLATGRQIYGIFGAPDHEVQYHPGEERAGFGYNHMLVGSKTEEEILAAYTQGRFYGSIYNTDLKFLDINYRTDTGLYVKTSKTATIKFITESGTTTTTGTEATFTNNSNVYVRVEATDGENTLYSNAIILV